MYRLNLPCPCSTAAPGCVRRECNLLAASSGMYRPNHPYPCSTGTPACAGLAVIFICVHLRKSAASQFVLSGISAGLYPCRSGVPPSPKIRTSIENTALVSFRPKRGPWVALAWPSQAVENSNFLICVHPWKSVVRTRSA